MPSLSALKYRVCPSGRAYLGAWYEVAESGKQRGAIQIRQLLGVRKELILHASPCPVCHSAVLAWGGWNRLENELNPVPVAEPEE